MTIFNSNIHGFEDPTARQIRSALTLNDLLVITPSSTQVFTSKSSFENVGIEVGDWLIVNATLKPNTSDLLLAELWGDLIVSPFSTLKSQPYADELNVLGVIQQSIHFLNKEVAPVLPEHSNLLDLDLHRTLVCRDISTVFIKAQGDAMAPSVASGDLLVLERHITPSDGDALDISLGEQLLLKRVDFTNRLLFSDSNPSVKQYVELDERIKFHGVVNTIIRFHRPI